MIDEKFIDEIKKYSLKDLELIYSTQKDLYSEDEMAVISEEINKRKNEIRERIKSKLPKDIVCPKCNGVVMTIKIFIKMMTAVVIVIAILFNML